MAFPASIPTLTDRESIDVIMSSEASIIQCMADLFCNVLVDDFKNTPNIDDQVENLKKVMCGYTAKENSIASVISSSAKKDAVDSGMNPTVVCKCECI